MKNRVPANPGRVLITPEDGSAAFYATLTRADNPTEEGDPLSKETLLKDATAALYGLDSTAVPDEVLVAARELIATAQSTADSKCKIVSGSYVGTGTYGEDNKNSLTFDSPPKLLIIASSGSSSYGGSKSYILLLYIPGLSGYVPAVFTNGSDGFYMVSISGSGNTVSWYSAESAAYQLNISGATYDYIVAI